MNKTLQMNNTLNKLGNYGIVPVVVLNDSKDAAPLAKALCDGGLACAEVTFRTDAAEESIRIMSEQFPEMLVGAGTILTTEQAERAIAAGAKFIVSPGLNPEVVAFCLEKNVPITPGVVTPSEMEQAIKLGLKIVKFFPAEPSGGLAMIKAVSAPYTMLQFMPTGGINPTNVREYLKYDKIFACGGSWMVKSSLIDSGDFDAITELTKEAAKIVAEIRG
ncbi:MAG: bifunctional 4-hydroxy-2-oxoglutarate aldolase/2-dehydro-3-deoxy-phosphogluconate aldolase [Lachnospiraceae bacterium]|nr:bifunctional 4-hydroxy-2-oxoglutarate aldolase/2-dehydro-3-deoxy-phosphogluconate aldolase [Lachnospiraceae bacterium]